MAPTSADCVDTQTTESKRERRKMFIKDLVFILFLVLGVIVGIGLGVGLKYLPEPWTPNDKRKIFYLRFPGDLLLNMLKLLILPLILSSLVTAMATLDKKASGKLGLGAMIYYMTTTLSAVILGIILVLAIHPGDPRDLSTIPRSGASKNTKPLDALLDLIRNCFPDNVITMCFQRETTDIDLVKDVPRNVSNGTHIVEVTDIIETPKLVVSSGMNVLGLVVFSIALGCVLNHLGDKGKPLYDLFNSLNDATMVLIKLVIWYSPIGIIFLVASKFVDTDDIADVAARLGMYMVTVLAGLAIHSIVVLPLLYFIVTRKNPGRFFTNMLKALCTAWGTASSSATLPVTMECLTNKNNIDERIVRFVIPVGATINMDGTALYEAVASIFIAQVNNISLSIADVIIISLTSTAAAVGAAGVPQAGLVTMVIVLTAVNLPTEDVTLILAIDWLLDRFRTAVNVWGDAIGAGVLDHIFRKTFAAPPDAHDTSSDSTSTCPSNEVPMKEEGPPGYANGVIYDNQAFESAQELTRTRL
ncbi:excitatory amino acid transporter 3-like [Pomacea canaliculata]|uniref:excitatory amino acid transporter 3-like n=1 Tax=Pomacea canaliculata TaxID=400727 RepID=UPI000D73E1D2|nr:excitatory amino acid transporter 3-like [Pomacea canaliculata]XP_025109090.1 excitatory amino acid transporter 3-like [Pomacea canaliculata]